MASRKEQKEQARTARIAREQEAAAKAAQTRRLQIFGGAIAIAVIAIVAVVLVLSGGSNKNTTTVADTSSAHAQVQKTVNAELAGIPQSGTTLGKASAKVTVDYFGDLQCPVCAAFTKGVSYYGSQPGGLPQFIQNYVRTGKAKLVYKSMCTATCNDFSESEFVTQQVAAYAAGPQAKFWNFAETFYREQGTEGSPYMTPAFLTSIANQVGLNTSKWTTDRKDPSYQQQVEADGNEATSLKLQGTPAVIMIGPKSRTLVNDGNFASYSDLESAYNSVS